MKEKINESSNRLKRIGMTGIGLCAICCALPIVGTFFGIGLLTALANYFEWAGVGVLLTTSILLIVYFIRRKKASSCDIDCNCKTKASDLDVT